jgi:hypothetical protein
MRQSAAPLDLVSTKSGEGQIAACGTDSKPHNNTNLNEPENRLF